MTESELWLLAVNAYERWRGTLIGDPPPSVLDVYEELTNPRVGDLVLETTTIRREPWDPAAIGYLIAIEGDVWHIERLDGRGTHRWANATFIKVAGTLRKSSRNPSAAAP